MSTKRTSLKERRAKDKRGVDAIFEASTQSSETTETREPLAKVTLYIRPDQVVAIEDIQLAERKNTW